MSDQAEPWVQELREQYDAFMSAKEASEILGVTRKTVYEVLERNPDLCMKPTPQRYRIIRDRLLEFVAKGGVRQTDGNKAA